MNGKDYFFILSRIVSYMVYMLIHLFIIKCQSFFAGPRSIGHLRASGIVSTGGVPLEGDEPTGLEGANGLYLFR